MKWYYLLGAFLIAFSCFSQAKSGTTMASQDQVDALLKQSKDFQWADSYRSLDYADQALALTRNINYQKGIAVANNLRGFCFWAFGDNDLAIQSAMEALEIGLKENDPLIQAESNYILARSYMDLNEQKKSNEFIKNAEQLAVKENNWELLCSIYNMKGVIKFIEDKRDSALFYYNMAYELGKQKGIAANQFPRIISNIGECYAAEDPNRAFTYYNEALSLAKATHNQISEASITDIIGHTYLHNNDLKSAEAYLNAALHLAQKLGLRRVIRHAYAGLVDIKLKQGRGEEALVYLRKYYTVRDSLLNTSKIRQIVEMEAKHALELKEQNVRLLENEMRIQNIWKNLLIALTILLIVLSIGIYQLQRYRYRKNRALLNLEIDYLTRQHKETIDKYKASLINDSNELLESYDQKLLKKAIAIVEKYISDPQFGVEKLAMEMNMSRTNLHRKIKSITGFPPNELIRSIRLRKAALLIINKVDTVTQIALMTGFDDYSYFSKAFKKHFGVSPSHYEEQHKGQLELLDDLK